MPPALKVKPSEIKIYNQPDCILPKSFFEGRFIPNLHPDSLDYGQWWNEQITRCENGWSDGGYSVSGPFYYHLNFKKINMVDIKTERTLIHQPYFSFEDQQLFNDVAYARKNKKGIILITGRGFGKSFDITTLVEHEFTFQEASECIVSASTDPYIKLFWEKLELGLNNQPSQLRIALKQDTQVIKQSGFEERNASTGQWEWFGTDRFIRKAVYDSDAERTRGTRPNIHVWEEVGSWTGAASLLDCYKKTEPSWWRGSIKMTFPIFIGTGGAMDSGGSLDAKIMFENPEEYGLLAFEYEGEKIGKFFPAYQKLTGYYEKSGESDTLGAKEWLDEKREKKKKNPDLYRQETAEFPYNPKEAFQTNGSGIFPIDILERRYVAIERDPILKKLVQRGNLEWIRDGAKYTDVKWVPDENGIFEIAEHPAWSNKSWTDGRIENLYISGCDSFDAAAEDSKGKKDSGKSPGSIMMFKRFYDISTTSRLFVAKLTQRTDDATEFYWNTLKLNMYYSSKMLAEYTKLGIFQHYITKGYEHFLYKRPRLDATVVKETMSTNRYGIVMPTQVKRYIVGQKAVEYVKESYDQLFFQSLIRDMMAFTYEGHDKNKHDETMAASLALLGDEDMYKVSAKKKETEEMRFPVYRRDAYGKLVFG